MEELLQQMLEKMATMQTSMASMQKELTEVKQSQTKLDSMQAEIAEIKQSQTKLDSIQQEITEIKQSQTRMENDLGKKVGLLHDGWQSHNEKLELILGKLDTIEEKVENHDIKIAVLDRRRKVK